MPKYLFEVVEVTTTTTVISAEADNEDAAYDLVYNHAWSGNVQRVDRPTTEKTFDINLLKTEGV
jgi:hypothetical protein